MPESDEHWHKFIAEFKHHPPTADRIVQAIYAARATLARNEQPVMDHLIDAIHPHTFFADACHQMFWMDLRGILDREHYPVFVAAKDMFWPRWDLRHEQPPANPIQEIVTELTVIRKELEFLKETIQRKPNLTVKR